MSKSIVPCLVFVERAMKVDQSANHRNTFDTIFEHDTMGSVLKHLGIGSKCRLVGASQVLARVVTMCSPSYRRFQTRSSVLCGSCSRTCRRAGVNDMYDAAQCIHHFFLQRDASAKFQSSVYAHFPLLVGVPRSVFVDCYMEATFRLCSQDRNGCKNGSPAVLVAYTQAR